MTEHIEHTNETNVAASIEPMMLYMGRLAREAARELALASTAQKNAALEAMARRIEARTGAILEANKNDIDAARGKGRDEAFIDRLALNEARVAAMALGLRDIAALPDPVGEMTASWTRPNGLQISRVRVPLGVIGIIYEVEAERDRRRRRALPQIRQRRDPALWL